VPVVAPHVGGVLGALIYMAGVGAHHHDAQPVPVSDDIKHSAEETETQQQPR